MKLIYKAKSKLEKFGVEVYNLLVENFPHTYFVGGMVRDLLLKRKVADIDIATQARPEKIIALLTKNGINCDAAAKNFGVIKTKRGRYEIEIATFRQDFYQNNRYPKISFTTSIKRDSQRRDFTVNSLYLSAKTKKILDFHHGIKDLQNKTLRFIGQPERRLCEDPLRIIRALRFAYDLDFSLAEKDFLALKKNLSLLKSLTASRTSAELNKCRSSATKNVIKQILVGKESLDKFF